MRNDFYGKLVDLYAGQELTEELTAELEQEAMSDPELSHDMFTLRKTVELLHTDSGAQFTAETHQRILLQMQMAGAEIESPAQESAPWQYNLPIQS
jgi:hypothetical protein